MHVGRRRHPPAGASPLCGSGYCRAGAGELGPQNHRATARLDAGPAGGQGVGARQLLGGGRHAAAAGGGGAGWRPDGAARYQLWPAETAAAAAASGHNIATGSLCAWAGDLLLRLGAGGGGLVHF
jgi:hypothetical protein